MGPENDETSNEIGVVDAFTESLKYTLVQQPVLCLATIADKAFGTKWADKTDFMEAPKPVEPGSAAWYARHLGSIAAVTIPVAVAGYGISRLRTGASAVALEAQQLRTLNGTPLSMRLSSATGEFKPPHTVAGAVERPKWVAPVEPDFSHLPLQQRPVNIGSQSGDAIAEDLSNFAAKPFTLDGKRYASVEGFYVSLKWSHDPAKADIAAGLVGGKAKRFGRGSDATHATYNGQTFELGGQEHHALIKRAIQAKLEQNPDVARGLMATGNRPIIHDLGYPEPPTTKLPSKDFARIMTLS
jgi:predicted NAD-dependent protein-ADP-ribosyltransferase YbiA (DUF1768 family)